MSSQKQLDDGWFVAVDDRQDGPLTASQAWHLVTSVQAGTPVQVWHPSYTDWRTLSGTPTPALPGPFPLPQLNLHEFRLSNARYITWIACGASPFFILGAAVSRALQDASVSALVVAIVGYFGWWLYLEQAGVRVTRTEISFPRRLALWPFPALWSRRLSIAEISGFECWASAGQVHWFRLRTAGGSSLIILDNTLHREVLVIALEQRLPKLGTN